ncbi:MAG: hypothetical protein GQ532_11785 [Methylomarinum sp.]|nr:hypothetical protein [Methylomarinum sp.]
MSFNPIALINENKRLNEQLRELKKGRYTLPSLCDYFSIGEVAFARFRKNTPDFPSPFLIGRKLFWSVDKVDEWVNNNVD